MPFTRSTPQTSNAPSEELSLIALIRKNAALFLPFRNGLLVGGLALTLTNLVGLSIPWQIKNAVDTLQRLFASPHPGQTVTITQGQWDAFYWQLAAIAGLALLTLLTRVASRVYLLGTGREIEASLRNRLYGHLLGMPPSFFAAHPIGELMSRVSNDVDATKSIFGGGIMLGLNTVLTYILTLPLMFALNAPLAGLTVLFYPLVIFAIRKMGRMVRTHFTGVQSVLAEITEAAQENLAGMTVIQSYALEAQESRRFEDLCDRYRIMYKKLIRLRIFMFMLLASLSGISVWLVLLVGGGQVINHKLDWGGFLAFTLYLEHLAWPTMALGWTIGIFQQGSAALQRIDELLHTPSTIPSGISNGHAKISSFPAAAEVFTQPGHISIRNLSFAYNNPYLNTLALKKKGQSEFDIKQTASLDAPVLQNISLDIQPGETIALVGPVGSGKSTLLSLLPRLYEVNEGQIFVEGQDIMQVDPLLLRERMVFMPQASFLFSTTVEGNIGWGMPQAANTGKAKPNGSNSKALELAMEMANVAAVHNDIAGLPEQYQTLVGERGLMLSGGQRQRVALARTLMTNAGILLLDDPFSNVDAETEERIVNALKSRQLLEKRTTLIATHRFSVIGLCDRVALLDKGHLIAIGTSEDLMATQPLYRRLHELQRLHDTLQEWEIAPELAGSVREGEAN